MNNQNINLINATPIGLILPIQNGNTGYFEQSYDTLTQVKMNIINLLNTRVGERRMQPTFGTRLWNLIFEQNIDILKDQSINIVNEDISAWIPNITIIDITSNILKNEDISSNSDIYMLRIVVSFMINITKKIDTVVVTINNITQ